MKNWNNFVFLQSFEFKYENEEKRVYLSKILTLSLFSFLVNEVAPISRPDPSNDWGEIEQPPSEPNKCKLNNSNDKSACFHLSGLVDACDEEGSPTWWENVEEEEDQVQRLFCSWNFVFPFLAAHFSNLIT